MKTLEQPADVFPVADGTYARHIVRDGAQLAVRVCEDCWRTMPRYVDFPAGLVSPESDGDHQGNFAKTRQTTVGDKLGVEHLRKVVCLDCYYAAFQRFYPGAALPELRADLVGDGHTPPAAVVVEPTAEFQAG